MASARQRGKRWTGLYRDASGKQKSAGAYVTEREALKAAEHAQALANPPQAIEAHPVSKRGKITVAAYAPKWLDGQSLEPNTRATYENSVKHIVKRIGSMAVADVDPDDIRGIVRYLEKLGRADATIRHVLVVAFQMFEAAARSKLRNDKSKSRRREGQDQWTYAGCPREQVGAIDDTIPSSSTSSWYVALFATMPGGGQR